MPFPARRLPTIRAGLLRSPTASLFLLPCAALAQEPQQTEAPDEGKEIVVTGIRSSLNSALNIKRDAPSIVDVINAEDIGRYPDLNIAESVQRISGVQISRSRGEGQTVNIRGLPAIFTLTTLNGHSIPNALLNTDSAATRAFDFTILAPEFVRTLEVYKAPTADLEEGGLAGTVNVRTPRAFEIGKRILTGSIQGEYSDNSGKIAPRGSVLFSDVVADGRLGITLGFSYSQRRPETHSASQSYVLQTERAGLGSGAQPADFNGNGVIDPDVSVRMPTTPLYWLFQEKRTRIGATGSLEFKANDELSFYVDGLYSKLDVEAVRNERIANLSNSRGLVSAGTELTTLDGYPTITRLELTQLDVRSNGRLEDRSGDLLTISSGGRWERDGWTVAVTGGYSRSQQELSNLALATVATGPGYFSANRGDDLFSIGYLGSFATAILDPNSFRVASINGEFQRKSSDRLYDGRIDVSREFGRSGLTKVSVGVRYADRKMYQDNGRLTILPAGVSALYGGLPAGSVAGSFSAAPFMTLVSAQRGSFLGTYSGGADFPRSFLVSDPSALLTTKSAAELIAAGTYTNDPTGITDVAEKTLAGYARADFDFGRLTGNVGLRAVQTWQTSLGVAPDLTQISVSFEAGSVTRVPTAAPVSVKRSYTDILPSLNLRYEASDSLLLRLGLSRTMARPNLADLAPTTTANGQSLTITQKNPFLDPYRANNVDLTAEWYFTRGGVLGVSAFYKDLKSLIVNDAAIEAFPVRVIQADGSITTTDLNFTVNRVTNGRGVKVKGFELFYQQAFTFLPAPFDGLGATANYTFIDNSDPERLTAASRHNFNVTGYYEKGPIGLRLSYAWRGPYLSAAPQGAVMGSRTLAYGTLDGSATWHLNQQIAFSIEAVNLLNAVQVDRYLSGIPNSYVDAGRRILFGARLSL
nr:TonB-dependent receptor [Sphingobium sp. BHU LFT2]